MEIPIKTTYVFKKNVTDFCLFEYITKQTNGKYISNERAYELMSELADLRTYEITGKRVFTELDF